MNKLVIDNNKSMLDNFTGEVIYTRDSSINLNGDNELFLVDNKYDLEFYLNDNSTCTINMFSSNKCSSKIIIKLKNNSSFTLVSSYKNHEKTVDSYEAFITGDNNKLDIIIHALAYKDLEVEAKIDVLKKTKNNELSESVKAYECGGCVTVKPLLYVNAFDVVANHKAVITNFLNENMFYLKSKGLNFLECKQIIEEGFIFQNMSDEFKNKIRKEYYE